MNKETLEAKINEMFSDKEPTVMEKFNIESMAAMMGCVVFWDDLIVREIKV